MQGGAVTFCLLSGRGSHLQCSPTNAVEGLEGLLVRPDHGVGGCSGWGKGQVWEDSHGVGRAVR
jgi:hypothetical protein